MAGPTFTGLLHAAGIAPGQSVGSKQAQEAKKRDGELLKVTLDGDDGGDAVKSISEAAAKASKKRNLKESVNGKGSPLKTRRVKLKEFAQMESAKVRGRIKAEADKTAIEDQGQSWRAERDEEISDLPSAPESQKSKARRGLSKAAGKLTEQGRCREIQVRYDNARALQDETERPGLSRSGRQKWMLNNLCTMLTICVEQHTGERPEKLLNPAATPE